MAPSAMAPDQPSPAPLVLKVVLGTRRGICVACLTGRYPLAPEAPLDKLRLALARGDANAAA